MRVNLPVLTMVLLAIWPFVSFLNNNQDGLLTYGGAVSLYGLVFLLGVACLAGLGVGVLGRSRTAAIAHVLGVSSVLLFSYLPLSNLLSALGISLGSVRIAIWLVGSLIVLSLVWRVSRGRKFDPVFAAAALVMTIVPAAGLVSFSLQGNGAMAPEIERTVARAEVQPNVYWFIFDAYARADVLEDYFGYDNSEFIEALADRGFDVKDAALANYASTKLSISTTASMDYFIPTDAPLHPSMWTAPLQGFNPVVGQFRDLGYRYIHAEPGGNNLKTRCGGIEDLCIKSAPKGMISISEADVGLLQLTPVFPIIRRLAPNLLSFDFTKIEDVTGRLDFGSQEPFLLFAHILSPHPPQRFDEACGLIAQVEFDLAGEDYSELVGGYLNDLKCLNREILVAVDMIMARDQSDPIIILQSDHGFRGTQLRPVREEVRVPLELVSFANLHAMRMPESCVTRTGEEFSPVNTFRIVFSCIDGEPREMLPGLQFRKENGVLHAFEADALPND